jgi:hypothetical protein
MFNLHNYNLVEIAIGFFTNIMPNQQMSFIHGSEQDEMTQWHYFRKKLHVILPKNKIFIQINFWTIIFEYLNIKWL